MAQLPASVLQRPWAVAAGAAAVAGAVAALAAAGAAEWAVRRSDRRHRAMLASMREQLEQLRAQLAALGADRAVSNGPVATQAAADVAADAVEGGAASLLRVPSVYFDANDTGRRRPPAIGSPRCACPDGGRHAARVGTAGAADVLARADALLARDQPQDALDLLTARLDEDEPAAAAPRPLAQRAEVLWRMARACYAIGSATDGAGEKRRWWLAGLQHALAAHEADDACAGAHHWLAIMTCSCAEFEGPAAQIKTAFFFREHLQRAIELAPDDPAQYFALGRWCYEVSQLSWVMRKAAATLFGSPPESSIDEALSLFSTAEQLRPGSWKLNMLWLGKCHRLRGDADTARELFERALALPCRNNEDRSAQQELVQQLRPSSRSWW